MAVLVKFVMRSIKEKKLRTFMMVFSIALSSALFFVSNTLSDTIQNNYKEQQKKYFGDADIQIYANVDSPSGYFRIKELNNLKENLEYLIGIVKVYGTYKTDAGRDIRIDLNGYDINDLNLMHNFELKSGSVKDFSGKKIIISSVDASEYNISLGDSIDIKIDGNKHKFLVSGIANPTGFFRLNSSGSFSVIADKNKMASILNKRGKINLIYAKSKVKTETQKNINELKNIFKRYSVTETISEYELKAASKSIDVPLKMMLVIVMLVSIFIIYTTFKVITFERLPVIGTFRSIGATKKKTDFIILMESLIYGVIGGALGCIIGVIILKLMSGMINQNSYSTYNESVKVIYSYKDFVNTFIISIVLSVLSSIIPIVKVSKISVKDIVLGNTSKSVDTKVYKNVLGIILIVISVIAPMKVDRSMLMIISVMSIGTSIIGLILLIPFIVKISSHILEKISFLIFRNIGIIAVKNLKSNRGLINNISLLTIGIASLLMINTVSTSVSKEVLDMYKNFEYDISISMSNLDKIKEQRIKTIEGVKEAYSFYDANNVELKNLEGKLECVYGGEFDKFFDYNKYEIETTSQDLNTLMNQDENILLTTMLRDKYSLKEGDYISFKLGNNSKSYKVVGFINTLLHNGSMAFLKGDEFKRDFGYSNKSQMYVRVNKNQNEVIKSIIDKLKYDRIWIESVDSMKQKNMQNNAQTFLMLKAFSVITMLIGLLGIFNNFIVNFMARRRVIAVMKSVGMSQKQVFKMVIAESVSTGSIGGILGCVGGVMLTFIVEFILKSMSIPVNLSYDSIFFVYSIFGGILVATLASVIPAAKSSKLSIIESVRY